MIGIGDGGCDGGRSIIFDGAEIEQESLEESLEEFLRCLSLLMLWDDFDLVI